MAERIKEFMSGPISEWPDGRGISMDLIIFSNGEFSRINFGPNKHLTDSDDIEETEMVWVAELKDEQWPIIRPATPQETEDFAIKAMKTAPNAEISKKLANYAIKVLEVQSAFIQARANRIKNTLEHYSKD